MSGKDTKIALLDAAEIAARQRGVDGFSYSDLSEAVGIRKASIHYHYPKKSDLLTALMARYAERVLGALQQSREIAPAPLQQLKACVALYRSALLSGSALCLCVAFTVSEGSLSDETLAEMQKFRRAVLNWLEAIFAAGLDADTLKSDLPSADAAQLFLAAMEGAQLSARVEKDPVRFDAVMDSALRQLID